jgi:multidrug efflux system outer membrane protein
VARGGGLSALALPEVPLGLPSRLLERRPDVLAAEQRLVAANARVGAARAAYFPAIALTGYAGSESVELARLLGSGTGVWQAALSVFEPLLHTGRTRRAVEVSRARARQAAAAYVKALQTAFAEVEDALAARATGADERRALERQVAALTRSRRLAELRYEAGESSYFEVLDAERSLFAAQLALTDARRAELAAAVVLFKSLGGGWEPGEPSAGSGPSPPGS